MPDRVKTALFDVLGSFYGCPGALPPIRVMDAFAGSGSMGLEALSRGVSKCWFIERHPAALTALRANIEALCAGAQSVLLVRDGWTQVTEAPDGRPLDLIFLDPPYRDSQDVSETGRVRSCLKTLGRVADRRPIVVLHHEAKVRYALPPNDVWRIADHRISGSNGLTIFES